MSIMIYYVSVILNRKFSKKLGHQPPLEAKLMARTLKSSHPKALQVF